MYCCLADGDDGSTIGVATGTLTIDPTVQYQLRADGAQGKFLVFFFSLSYK